MGMVTVGAWGTDVATLGALVTELMCLSGTGTGLGFETADSGIEGGGGGGGVMSMNTGVATFEGGGGVATTAGVETLGFAGVW